MGGSLGALLLSLRIQRPVMARTFPTQPLDDLLSGPIRRLELGLVLERLASMPGSFFGMPFTINLVVLPLAALACEFALSGSVQFPLIAFATVLASSSIAVFWLCFVLNGHELPPPWAVKLFSPGMIAFQTALGVLPLRPGWVLPSDTSTHTAVHYMLCVTWLCVILCQFVKQSVLRERPDPEPGVTRHVNFVQFMKGKQRFESFPSGDAAQAGAWCSAVSWVTGQPIFMVPLFLSMFGRVYFYCHFVVDVTVGAFVGIASTLLTNWILEQTSSTWRDIKGVHAIGCMVAVIVCDVVMKKLHARPDLSSKATASAKTD